MTGALTLAVAWQFGFTMQALAAMFFTWCLIALTMIGGNREQKCSGSSAESVIADLSLSVGGMELIKVGSVLDALLELSDAS